MATARVGRREFVAALIAEIPGALVITGLGSPTYDVYAAGHRQQNFYLWGAMGAAVPIALGLALAQPEQSVVAITGDGEHLMGIGALATVGAARAANLTVVVLDNGHFGETGMQRSHTGLGTDLIAVARGFGIDTVLQANSLSDTSLVADRVRSLAGTTYVHVLIHADEPPRVLPPRDGVANKNAFRAALGLPTI
jgi:phosphonopyruvate decarboxylase